LRDCRDECLLAKADFAKYEWALCRWETTSVLYFLFTHLVQDGLSLANMAQRTASIIFMLRLIQVSAELAWIG
jgi:hypothetical protein